MIDLWHYQESVARHEAIRTELLEACEYLLEVWTSEWDTSLNWEARAEARAMAIAAVKKARAEL